MSTDGTVHSVTPSTVNPTDPSASLTDAASNAFLQRGAVLDNEVRRLVGQVEQSNTYLAEIGKLITEANRIVYKGDEVTTTSWTASDFTSDAKTVTLDNGYGLVFGENGTFAITDNKGNSLAFADGMLIPTQAGQAPATGIQLTGNTSIILDDSTKITLNVSSTSAVTDIIISRGNQGMAINTVNTTPIPGTPVIYPVTADSQTQTTHYNNDLDNATVDGDILIENGGVNSLLNAGEDVIKYETSAGILTDEQKHFINNQLNIDINLTGALTTSLWSELKSQLILARDNLTGSNQLQTVQLQSALTRYNQNYDAMSNTQNKIYTLLKDMLSNLK